MQDRIHPFPPSRPDIWPDYLTKVVRCGDDGFVLGSDMPLVRPTGPGRFVLGEDGGRCLALLSVFCRRPVGADMLRPLEAAAIHWASGDKALANLRLVFSGLPKLDAPADAARLQAAAYCLDNGMAPRDLMKALDLDSSVLDLVKFDPDQPRVPAGNGDESGRWTSDGIDETTDGVVQTVVDAPPNPSFETSEAVWSRATLNTVRVAADGPFRPGGIIVVPFLGTDPLDPQRLNAPLSLSEQQAIADTVNTILAARPEDMKTLNPHEYQNRPDPNTGAILPPGIGGYTTYYVRTLGAAPGERRVIMDKAIHIYYTNNHYKSYYPVDIKVHPIK